MHRITKGVICALLASAMSVQTVPALAQKHYDRDRDRYEQRREAERRYEERRYDEKRNVPRAWRNYDERNFESERF